MNVLDLDVQANLVQQMFRKRQLNENKNKTTLIIIISCPCNR
jgi:hypothetical protein